ncbi:hypothetical protein M5D96_008177 [Drosophila gunungcola]|uniref:Uncharacterized protein n=1 Tax=Drosophila gunungcola TaxID=103775 RepID=A0A9P9YM12_9MUSC|nr:hypothetical protein M5D96_008177 [Drosophila gunungcola]
MKLFFNLTSSTMWLKLLLTKYDLILRRLTHICKSLAPCFGYLVVIYFILQAPLNHSISNYYHFVFTTVLYLFLCLFGEN